GWRRGDAGQNGQTQNLHPKKLHGYEEAQASLRIKEEQLCRRHTTEPTQNGARLTGECSRRRRRRSIVAGTAGKRRLEVRRVRNRRKETGRHCCQKEVEFRQQLLRFVLLLRLFSCVNKFANRTGMFAIECSGQRFLKRRRL